MSCLSSYRFVNLTNKKYPPWVSTLAGRSGVYVIRSFLTARTLYIGESHTGRLRKTMLRHFQAWDGPTAGNLYGRGNVEVAVCFERRDRAQDRQSELIRRLGPRDNSG